ncbi:blastoderm-specific protein 25D isoform X5 [Bradysia coprophila]|uniref:blastoderm-specific protein 25D isoform X5 n=1 Tax=Bradysia coprophila TaxID=38358 RepID=UPI00187DB153|nr:blastoderm-specific protein 25D isoform X5 [Bradysia coprophila]
MEISTDPYEQKLYHMFKSHDVDAKGSLDKDALSKLCKTLELKEREPLLIAALVKNNGNNRVTFKKFKEELLNLLGTEGDDTAPSTPSSDEDTLVSGQQSPSREVSPKFIVGGKKYGRRSRPQSASFDSQSDSDNEYLTQTDQHNSKTMKSLKVQRSSSHSDIHGSKRRRPLTGTKLKRCASLPAQKPKKDERAQLQTQLESSVESLDKWSAESTAVPCTVIIDMWETAGISDPKALLQSLGFTAEEIHISQLSMAIDDDLQGDEGTNSQSTPLLKASLALHKAEVNALQQAFKQLAAENRKLHTNNRDANRQAALLAQEVDERHAQIENSSKTKIFQLEQRHAEIVRDLTAKLANDREHWTNLTSKLEMRIKSLEQEETKHRNDFVTLKKSNSALETEQISLQNQIADLLEMNIKLNNEIVDVEERQRNDDTNKSEEHSVQMIELMDKMSDLQVENTNLRDKIDELSTELEDRCLEITKLKSKKMSARAESTAIEEFSDLECSSNSATKRRGDSPSKAKISEESPRLGKLRKCADDAEPDSEGSGDWIALNSELNRVPTKRTSSATTTSGFSQEFSSLSDCKDEEIKQLKAKVAELESALKMSSEHTSEESEITKLKSRNQELESSLELMNKEFENLEDYWQGKLGEERQLYEEEQRISDEKFNELLKKMSEYEEQFPSQPEKDGRLSPIEEKCQLELQYAELEAETEEIKDLARQMLDEKSKEISDLQKKLKELHQRIGESFTPPPHNTDHLNTDVDSPASSPINYLWQQSTIQAPARDYHNPNWNAKSVHPIQCSSSADEIERKAISPIQRPVTPGSRNADNHKDNVSDASSVHSFTTHSIASTHSVHKSLPEAIASSSPQDLREDIKRLQIIELQLKEAVQNLYQQRETLIMELQQLQEAKPVLEKAYARSSHPSLMQRIQQLEMKNRHLQQCLKQQQLYTETLMNQSWHQQRNEITELCQRIEAQNNLIAEQSHRLTNADLLVKDLYVENSQLTAALQRLEQQRNRNSLILQHGITGIPGMP